MINVYQVDWTISSGGYPEPIDPVTGWGGGCSDKYGTDIIPAVSTRQAETIVKKARPSANINNSVFLMSLHT